jgi:pSer/pThr/pTyr-binding forkhead associated (FHA) protein
MDRVAGECPHCGQRVVANTDRCPHCKQNMIAKPRSAPGPAQRLCPTDGCGARLQLDVASCRYCGEPVTQSEATAVAVTIAGSTRELLPGGALHIGRSEGSPLAESLGELHQISREHARLENRDDGLWIIDLGSLNGTYVDDRRLDPQLPAPLQLGSALRLGLDVPVELAVRAQHPEGDS